MYHDMSVSNIRRLENQEQNKRKIHFEQKLSFPVNNGHQNRRNDQNTKHAGR